MKAIELLAFGLAFGITGAWCWWCYEKADEGSGFKLLLGWEATIACLGALVCLTSGLGHVLFPWLAG
jgi:hypothetical protein